MAVIKMNELLEVGVHFGHQTRRWDPRMSPYVFGVKNGIYIIDLQQTLDLFEQAYEYVLNLTARGGKVIFVGTKRQAAPIIEEEAQRAGMHWVSKRWLGGMLTNFKTIRRSVDTIKAIERMENEQSFPGLTKKEILMLRRKRAKMEETLAGVKEMSKLPDAMFVIDIRRERIAVQEAQLCGIPIVAVVDTNCNPEVADYVIPGNDDAIRAIRLFTSRIGQACIEGGRRYQEFVRQEEKRQAEENARAAREAAARRVAQQSESSDGEEPARKGDGPVVKKARVSDKPRRPRTTKPKTEDKPAAEAAPEAAKSEDKPAEAAKAEEKPAEPATDAPATPGGSIEDEK